MAFQAPLWFLCADVLPITATATLSLVLLFGDEPEYLANNSLEGSQYQKFRFCSVCDTTVLPVLRNKIRVDSVPHHRTPKTLFEAMQGGCRICSTVWQRRTSTTKDVWGILLFWKPITTFRNDSAFLYVYLEENRRDKHRCRFKLLETECMSSLA
jgi:hypothetical protein